MFCLSESELAIPNQNSNPLKNSWVHALANAIVDGNTVYDSICWRGKGKLFLIDTHYDILSGSGSKFVLENAQGVSEFIRKEARQFTKKLRYGVLTMVEFLS